MKLDLHRVSAVTINLLRVDSYDGTTNSGSYGFTVKYKGTGSGNLNSNN